MAPSEERAQRAITLELSQTVGRRAIARLRDLLVEYSNQALCSELSETDLSRLQRDLDLDLVSTLGTRFFVERGIVELPGEACIVVTNHLGLGKAVKFDRAALACRATVEPFEDSHVFPNDEPFMLRSAAVRVALEKALGERPVFAVQIQYPALGMRIQRGYGSILLGSNGRGSVSALAQVARTLLETVPQLIISITPEGGTSGKRTPPWDPHLLEPFHTGAFVVADQLGLPIVPVVQVVGAEVGHRVVVMAPFRCVDQLADHHSAATWLRRRMQSEIDALLRGTSAAFEIAR
jgi:hypothetical protein